jgi:hypothetical protein
MTAEELKINANYLAIKRKEIEGVQPVIIVKNERRHNIPRYSIDN